MKHQSHLIAGACIAAIALCGTVTAAEKKSPSPSPASSAEASPAAAKAPRALPFRGTATAVDQSAMTFTIAGKESSRVFKATDKTTVTKAGAAAKMSDLENDMAVTGSYWKQEDGTLELKSLKIGGKTDAEKAAAGSKSKKASGDAAASPSASPKK